MSTAEFKPPVSPKLTESEAKGSPLVIIPWDSHNHDNNEDEDNNRDGEPQIPEQKPEVNTQAPEEARIDKFLALLQLHYRGTKNTQQTSESCVHTQTTNIFHAEIRNVIVIKNKDPDHSMPEKATGTICFTLGNKNVSNHNQNKAWIDLSIDHRI
ncbi:hypothetical protein PENSTE_c003G08925 [Penicillium steckii]|uniref:Uncharacterized protein n=1 Tax=Penicillium steckii TaxID=303698 RepID=A0A1V6TR10_9EURO|nr:hypothetical protein PENSTE_c003G08925 [Penicillium steckii]